MKKKHIYGPVPSRRLGFSLGVDLVPFKTCSFNCIYCQLGKTTNKTIRRKEYVPASEILEELKNILEKHPNIDYITFSGSGEPTLNSKIGYLINKIKKITKIPIAVITNGSLLFIPEVQNDLLNADVVLPTLCVAREKIFKKINRPHPKINLKKIIKGQMQFRKKYKGKIWLEIMLVKNFNDSPQEIRKLKEIISKIKPDKIQLNTVVRPPSENYAIALSNLELKRIKKMMGRNCEIIADFRKQSREVFFKKRENAILHFLKRRPGTQLDIEKSLGMSLNEIVKYLNNLLKRKMIKKLKYGEKIFYVAKEI